MIEAGIAAQDERLSRAGLLVLNPPFGFEGQMREVVSLVAPRWPGGNFALEWLRSEEP